MKFGLTDKEINLIKDVFKQFTKVESVFIYGSRAKGNFKKTSDVDLAIRFEPGFNGGVAKIKSALDDLPIIYEIDAVDEAEVADGNFKEEYQSTKKPFD